MKIEKCAHCGSPACITFLPQDDEIDEDCYAVQCEDYCEASVYPFIYSTHRNKAVSKWNRAQWNFWSKPSLEREPPVFFSPESAEFAYTGSRHWRRSPRLGDFSRSYVRLGSRIICAFWWTDYSRDAGNGGVTYVKRVTRSRFGRGFHWQHGEYLHETVQWFLDLPADTWCEIEDARPVLLLTCDERKAS